ncbi:MAG: DUF6062 family protein [Anaerolineae bacterium]|nr:DUF6062 family protein [Anaerolineae bacterium]NUQ06740.1 hypothetical protein [Anaerolineae bacterium]
MTHKTFGYFDLLETFPKPGCAVCNLLLRDTHAFLDSIMYEYVMDPETQNKFRDSRGLCDQHGWQIAQMGSGLGVAVLYERALGDLLETLNAAAKGTTRSGGLSRLRGGKEGTALADALEPSQPCIACKHLTESEARYLKEISQHANDPKLQAAYSASDGLCLEHFRGLLRVTGSPARLQTLIAMQTDIWTRLRAELNEFMRKSDFNNAGEKMGVEGSSWRRVVARLGGEHGVFGLRRLKP